MKGKKLFLGLAVMALFLSGCGRQEPMDQVVNGQYNYRNEAYGFELDLPEEFIYYQTQSKSGQRKTGEITTDWHDIEFFVPIGDRTYAQEVPGYGKAMVVRVFEIGKYQKGDDFEVLVDTGGRVYAVAFWKNIPADDWRQKWNSDIAQKIKKSFRISE